jgi:hypothetical protein
MKWAGHVAQIGEMRNAYILVESPLGKRPVEKSRGSWTIILKWIKK